MKKRITTLILETIILIVGVTSGIAIAGIRMTNDQKPKVVVYKLKEMNDGSISFRTNEDTDKEYEVGDFIIMGDTTGHYIGNSPDVTTLHKFVVIAKK